MPDLGPPAVGPDLGPAGSDASEGVAADSLAPPSEPSADAQLNPDERADASPPQRTSAADATTAALEALAEATFAPVRGIVRVDSVWLGVTTLVYVLAGAAATGIALYDGLADWSLYALASLCTAVVVSGYCRLKPRVGLIRRLVAWFFATAVVVAWSALLSEHTRPGWRVVGDKVVLAGAEPMFWVPAGLGGLAAVLLTVHFFLVAPRVRLRGGRN